MSVATLDILGTDALNDLIVATDTIAQQLSGDELKLTMGLAMQETIRDHFSDISQDSAHHKSARSLGAQPTGVYEEARAHTDAPVVEADGVSVSIHSDALAQRYYGGPIQGDPLLTIPARPEAYGHRAGEFDNLRVVMFPSGAGALVQRDATALRGTSKSVAKGKLKKTLTEGASAKGSDFGGLLFYWLVKSVSQEGDPTVLPTDDEMLSSALGHAQDAITQVFEQISLSA